MNHMRRLGPLRTAWADTGATRWPACPRTSSAPKCARNAAGSPAGNRSSPWMAVPRAQMTVPRAGLRVRRTVRHTGDTAVVPSCRGAL